MLVNTQGFYKDSPMKPSLLKSLGILTALASGVFAQMDTVILQNGLNGYTGTTDASIASKTGGANYGNDQTFSCSNDLCKT